MLSTIGRAAIRRIGGGSASRNRALQCLWSLQRADHTQSQTARSYVTASKAAAKPKAKATTKTKTATKGKTGPKTGAKKAVVKKKVAAKKKKVALKKKAATKKKVPATEEQKSKIELKVLKAKALLDEEPKGLPSTAWVVMMTEALKSNTGKTSLVSDMPAISAKYKELGPSELEAYNHIANQNKSANAIAQKKWVELHTPDEINLANNARKLLQKRTKTTKYRPIHDERIPKRPTNANMQFRKERYASGDMKGVGDISTIAKLLTEEWNALSASEKSIYEARAAADTERYVQEYKTVFKRDSKTKVPVTA